MASDKRSAAAFSSTIDDLNAAHLSARGVKGLGTPQGPGQAATAGTAAASATPASASRGQLGGDRRASNRLAHRQRLHKLDAAASSQAAATLGRSLAVIGAETKADASWPVGGDSGGSIVPSLRRHLLAEKDGDRIWTGTDVSSACVAMQKKEQARLKERARERRHAYNQRLRTAGIVFGYICAAFAALYCCAKCCKHDSKRATQQPAATGPAAAAAAAAAAGPVAAAAAANTTPAVVPAATQPLAAASPAPVARPLPKAASTCLPPLLATENKGGGFPVPPPKSKELAQAAKACADAALSEAVAAAAALQLMLRGYSPAASAADVKMSPPPGWVSSWCAGSGSKLLQQPQRVQFCMLPWADPQALHEMMRQGVSREHAEVALLLHRQDGNAAMAWLAGLAASGQSAATASEAADVRGSWASLQQRQEVERVLRRACGPRGGLARHQVRAVFRVCNPRLWGDYAQRCQEIAEDLKIGATDANLARMINEQMLFHASNRDALAAICAHGFDARLWRSERYGKGLYFACSAKTSTGYVGRDLQADVAEHVKAAGDRLPEVGAPGQSSVWKAMLLCRVALGTVSTGSRELRRPNHGYHSSCSNSIVIGKRTSGAGGKGPRYSESVIFDGAQAYPAYLLFFAAT